MICSGLYVYIYMHSVTLFQIYIAFLWFIALETIEHVTVRTNSSKKIFTYIGRRFYEDNFLKLMISSQPII